MNLVVFGEDTYPAMERDVPAGHRGYLYALKDAVTHEGETYDYVLGYEVVAEAPGLSQGLTAADLPHILPWLHPDAPIRVIPFYKYADLRSQDIVYGEMEALAKSSGGGLTTFFLMDSRLGFFCCREIEEHGLPSYSNEPARALGEPTEEQVARFQEGKGLLERRGIKIAP